MRLAFPIATFHQTILEPPSHDPGWRHAHLPAGQVDLIAAQMHVGVGNSPAASRKRRQSAPYVPFRVGSSGPVPVRCPASSKHSASRSG